MIWGFALHRRTRIEDARSSRANWGFAGSMRGTELPSLALKLDHSSTTDSQTSRQGTAIALIGVASVCSRKRRTSKCPIAVVARMPGQGSPASPSNQLTSEYFAPTSGLSLSRSGSTNLSATSIWSYEGYPKNSSQLLARPSSTNTSPGVQSLKERIDSERQRRVW